MAKFLLSSLVRPTSKIVVMDIGASLLETPPYQPLLYTGLVKLIGFEPNDAECEKLRLHHGEPHQFFPYFIGDGRPATFHETNWFATGSLYKPNKPLLEIFQNLYELVTPVSEHSIATKALDDIPEIDSVDYLKIDVQGAELAVFKGAEKLLDTTLVIQTEVEFLELYENQPLFADVDTHLRSRGFSLVKFLGFGTRSIKPAIINNNINVGNQLLWADALYMRNWIDTSTFSPDQLIKLAIIANDIYGLLDFSFYMLNQLDARMGSNYAQTYVELASRGAPAS